LERRSAIGGNVRDEQQEGIHVHKYGPHIFHTNNKEVWDFANRFAEFNHFRYCPLARNGEQLYHLPFNMNTFYEVYGVKTPHEAKNELQKEHEKEYYESPINLEQQAVSLVGRKLYELLIKGYTEKQWGKKATELPAFIINRLPLRFRYDNNYFNDMYQGIPIGGIPLG
jgi:UDP-galactopyranose mutase